MFSLLSDLNALKDAILAGAPHPIFKSFIKVQQDGDSIWDGFEGSAPVMFASQDKEECEKVIMECCALAKHPKTAAGMSALDGSRLKILFDLMSKWLPLILPLIMQPSPE